jgi:hypothetical protein
MRLVALVSGRPAYHLCSPELKSRAARHNEQWRIPSCALCVLLVKGIGGRRRL